VTSRDVLSDRGPVNTQPSRVLEPSFASQKAEIVDCYVSKSVDPEVEMATEPHPPPPPQPYYPARPTNGLGVAAMVLGIVGFLILWIPFIGYIGLVCGVLALILGIVGTATARRRGAGVGMAITGIILGALTVVLAIAGLVALGEAVRQLDQQLNR
jgi:hypothetical protein